MRSFESMRHSMRVVSVLVFFVAGMFLFAASGLANSDFDALTYKFISVVFPADAGLTNLSGINDRGKLIGNYLIGSGTQIHGFLAQLKGRHVHDFAKVDFPGSTMTETLGINIHSHVVGVYMMPGSSVTHGYILADGNFQTLDAPNASNTTPIGINDAGDIVGSFTPTGQAQNQGFLYTGGQFITISFPGADVTTPNGINNSGEISGTYVINFKGEFPFTYKDGNFNTIALPGPPITINAYLNQRGDVAGTFLDLKTGFGHGFVDRSGKITQVDYPGATAIVLTGINDGEQVVGVWFGSACKLVDLNCGFVGIPVKDCEKDKDKDDQRVCEDNDGRRDLD